MANSDQITRTIFDIENKLFFFCEARKQLEAALTEAAGYHREVAMACTPSPQLLADDPGATISIRFDRQALDQIEHAIATLKCIAWDLEHGKKEEEVNRDTEHSS